MKTNFLTQSSNLDFILNALLAISGCMPGAVFYVTLEPRRDAQTGHAIWQRDVRKVLSLHSQWGL